MRGLNLNHERTEEMKRQNYEIRCNGALVKTKHAWNSARKEIPAIVRSIMTGKRAEETSWYGGKATDFQHGESVWEDDTGTSYRITITRTDTEG